MLINNADINGGMPQSALDADSSQFQRVFNNNFFGVTAVTQAFTYLLRQSPAPRIVSSAQGSLTLHSDPAPGS